MQRTHSAPQAIPSSTSPTLEQPLALVKNEIAAVNRLILQKVDSDVPLIKDIASHLIASGGKRLRPVMTLLSARLCGYEGERHIALAAAVEFIHTATLLHDDVVDESSLRRGSPTANAVFGNQGSVLVGDFLLAQAFRIMVADESLEVLDILSSAAAVISAGEVKQLMTAGDPTTSIETYMDVIQGKTAELFAAACEIGPVIADKPKLRTQLRQIGNATGLAFQLVDDALDYCADEARLGKHIGDDFREAKITYPVLMAYQNGTPSDRKFWQRCFSEDTATEADLQQAIAIIQRTGAISACFSEAEKHCRQARESLLTLPERPEREAMLEIVDFCSQRMY